MYNTKQKLKAFVWTPRLKTATLPVDSYNVTTLAFAACQFHQQCLAITRCVAVSADVINDGKANNLLTYIYIFI